MARGLLRPSFALGRPLVRQSCPISTVDAGKFQYRPNGVGRGGGQAILNETIRLKCG